MLKEKSPAAQLVEQEIQRFGPMTFAQFVDLALYHPRYGAYNQKAPLQGRSGDYFTSLQVSDLFPRVVAEVLIQMRQALGTEQFSLVELGPGRGAFLTGVLQALEQKGEAKGFRFWAVERSATARENLYRTLSRFRKSEVVSSLDEIEASLPLEGCVFSNEFFDALPFHRLRYHAAGWKEIYVSSENGELREEEGALSDPNWVSDYRLSDI